MTKWRPKPPRERRPGRAKKEKTHPDMRRPPPGGRAGVVPTADSGGEESGRVSTVANDP
ncbi:hypothetical protein GCM10010383_48070 [Streptomyces lomondensis]|uniref:Uncharacterized protein n=1 Tax=Streptomyces lomondensis TaxID=68229 RepID=A0ABQ2XFN2_9ACTN|nr:hypothetical protein GCM10010383_48070 [Streptomyces lomondensis]